MSFKLNIIGRRRAGMSLAEHRHHIRPVHGELVLRYIRAEPENAPRRCVQNAVFDGQYRASASGADPVAFTSAWVQAANRPGAAALRHGQNELLGRPGTWMPADAIDGFGLATELAARTQLSAWRAVLHEQLVQPGLAIDGSLVALMARDDVVHAGPA